MALGAVPAHRGIGGQDVEVIVPAVLALQAFKVGDDLAAADGVGAVLLRDDGFGERAPRHVLRGGKQLVVPARLLRPVLGKLELVGGLGVLRLADALGLDERGRDLIELLVALGLGLHHHQNKVVVFAGAADDGDVVIGIFRVAGVAHIHVVLQHGIALQHRFAVGQRAAAAELVGGQEVQRVDVDVQPLGQIDVPAVLIVAVRIFVLIRDGEDGIVGYVLGTVGAE